MGVLTKTALSLAVLAMLTMAGSAQQSSPKNQEQTPGMQNMPGMQNGQMPMNDMMGKCHKNMHSMMQSNEKVRTDLQAAEQSNDPVKMRAALEEADHALAGMNQHMTMCMKMMNMGQNMGGMMGDHQSEPGSQKAPKQ